MALLPTTILLLLLKVAWASHQCSWDPSEAVLQCSLKWKKSPLTLTFSKHQREATGALKIFCTEKDDEAVAANKERKRLTVDYESDRRRRETNLWPHLKSLQVHNCPLNAIDIVLKGRQLRTRGDILHDVIKPMLGGRSLSGLRHLSLVNAAFTSSRGQVDFSSSLWCEVGSNLVSLNLSSNGLAQVPTSINGSCEHGYRHLEVINLSNNVMTDLDGLSSSSSQLLAPSLTHLDVSKNRLQVFKLPDNMSRLKFVDVSENKLTSSWLGALSASAATLQELHAQGNQMESLPNLSTDDGGSVINFDSLVVLNLSRNAISHSDRRQVNVGSGGGDHHVSGLKALVALDLSHNKMSLVDGHLFRDLSSLQVLSLAHNQLVELRPDSLTKLTRLHVLVLSHNNLDENGLADGILRHMTDLRTLNLDHNRLKSLPRELFRGCSSLRDLSLSANFLRQWPSASLKPIAHHLHTLDMGENSLRELEPLAGFQQLYGLRLSGNRLRNLTAETFVHSLHIKMLNVADNLLEHIDQSTFEPLKHLKALRLDNNRLEDINGLLTVQHQLQWLNVSHNHLQWFDYAIIPKSVIWLSLRHNRIEELGNYYGMQEGFHLTHLDIGHNALIRMDRQALQPSLREIIADHNSIAELAPNMFNDLINLTLVNMTHNRLETFPLSALTLSLDHGSMVLGLSNNPLECDCEMEWLQRINSLAAKSPREFPMVADWSLLTCQLNNRASTNVTTVAVSKLLPVSVSSVRPSEFLCPYETHCFALCMCCDFFACDCRMKCSDGCNCFHDQTWSSNIIECGNRQHTNVPEFIPMDATSLYLDGNKFDNDALINDEFIGRKHLTSLYLNDSSVSVLTNQTFQGLSELQVLHLEDNKLKSLGNGLEFGELRSLRELYLHNNALEFIHEDTLRPVASSLRILTLHGNRLKVEDFHVWEYMGPRLRSLSLGGSDNQCLSCQCDVVEKFSAALKANPGLHVVDLEDIKCFNESSPLVMKNSSSCADVLAVSFRRNGETLWASWDSFVPVLAVTVASTIIVISLIILAVAARKPIRSWFQRRYDGIQRSNIYGSIVNGTGRSSTKYDILLVSAPADEDFVNETLVNVLTSQNYRVGFHSLTSAATSPRNLEHCGGVCFVASHQSYIQNSPEDLLALSKVCRESSRPLVLIALDTTAAKTLRRIPVSELRSTKTLLWDTKSFWPSWRSVFPPPPPAMPPPHEMISSPPSMAVKKEDDTWTYLKPTSGSGESSLSTQSTDTMTMSGARRFSTQRASSSQHQQRQLASSTLHTAASGLGSRQRSLRPHVIENPMTAGSSTHHRSRFPATRHSPAAEEEPIYHSLDEESIIAATAAHDQLDGDVTVYINADLELVYPSPNDLVDKGNAAQCLSDDEEAELNGLLADCYENEESLLASDYVPSPAPGSYPRHHLSYTAAAATSAAATSSSKRRQHQQPLSRGYLV